MTHPAREWRGVLAEDPEMATEKMQRWADRQCCDPTGCILVLRFNQDRPPLPAELPGTGAIARALIAAGAFEHQAS